MLPAAPAKMRKQVGSRQKTAKKSVHLSHVSMFYKRSKRNTEREVATSIYYFSLT